MLGLAGNSGTPPALHEMLLGVSELAGEPGRRVVTRFDKATSKLDIRSIPFVSDVTMPDGSVGRRIVVDHRDIGLLPAMVQRERERYGAPPLSDGQLAAEVQSAAANVTTVDNPRVLIKRTYSFAFLRHALAKIAYELAFVWLGESYLTDPSANDLRAAICSADPAGADSLPMWLGPADDCDAFRLWATDKTQHIAYAMAGDDGIAIAIRVFDIHAAVLWVTKDASAYLSGVGGGWDRMRFLAIEPTTGAMRSASIMGEMMRNAKAAGAARRAAQLETRTDLATPIGD